MRSPPRTQNRDPRRPAPRDGRTHQHQSQQGRAHRASAQRHPGRHLCPPAARHRASKVDVQNYIDNTGVQVADVVVGFITSRRKRGRCAQVADCERRAGPARGIDYYCWDLYARVGLGTRAARIEENAERKKVRYETLHQIEHGGTRPPKWRELISTAVVRRHLETMLRLGHRIRLPAARERDSAPEVLGAAFELLKQREASVLRNEGQEDRLLGDAAARNRSGRRRDRRGRQGHRALQRNGDVCRQGHRLSPLEVRPPRPRFRLQALLHLPASTSAGYRPSTEWSRIRTLVERRRFTT